MKRNKIIVYKSILLLFFAFLNTQSHCQEVLIQNGDSWSYYDNGYLENDWYKKQNYQDWKKGSTPIGYGDRIVTTEINYGNNPDDKEVVKYFTKKITLKDVSKFKGYEFRLQRDDGAIVFVNGEELYRDNMPEGHISNVTKSIRVIDVEEEPLFNVKIFDSTIFKNGENIINIQIHQVNSYSSDCIFSLEIIGHTNPNILTEVIKEQIETNSTLETKIDTLNYNFILKNTATQLEIYKSSNQNLLFTCSSWRPINHNNYSQFHCLF